MRHVLAIIALSLLFSTNSLSAQELVQDQGETVKARVTGVISEEKKTIPGTDVTAAYQTIRVSILEGVEKGNEVTIENDYLMLREGDTFYLYRGVDAIDGSVTYAVMEPYRLPALGMLALVFLGVVAFFGGKQGLRGLLSLAASLFLIVFLLLPGVMKGYPPALISLGVVSLIIVVGSYVTHGVSKMTTVAVFGMVITVLLTGLLAVAAIYFTDLSGFTGDETTYLNLNTRGQIDFAGLLLGAILIGLLGVLYDAAIGQSVAVEELVAAGPHLTRREIYQRALRIGREHIGALVNTLAIAYVGAALPLLLLFYGSSELDIGMTVNREIFASEIVRVLVSSIGVVLVVPITTALASFILKRA